MTSKESLKILNKYRNENYNSINKNEVELANAINVILPKYVKQEKLLELYKKQNSIYKKLMTMELSRLALDSQYYEIELFKIEYKIKELEE